MSCKSSFHGKIDEIPGIAVDNFTGDNLNSRAFFISHYHRDHIQGLDSWKLYNHLKRTKACIYTSEITASIINFEMEYSDILEYVKPLGRESTLITLPSKPEDDLEELFIEVTLIPAGHSFGSTMFLFKTAQKTILYTGDFRIRINDISKYGKLHKNNDPLYIDSMYIDTTFIDAKYEDFAKRTDTADTVIDEIDKWLKIDDKNAVSVYMFANYTFEFLLNKIYQRLNKKVYIGDDKWAFYSKIQHQVCGVTNDPNESRIHLCRYKTERKNHDACIPWFYTRNISYLHIHLTAMKWDNYSVDQSPIIRKSDTALDACFATHCSRSEIIHFVTYFKPSKVEGFPKSYVEPDAPSDDEEEFVLTPKTSLSSTKKRPHEDVSKESVNKVVKKIL